MFQVKKVGLTLFTPYRRCADALVILNVPKVCANVRTEK